MIEIEYEDKKSVIKNLPGDVKRPVGFKPNCVFGDKPVLKSANNYRSRLRIGGSFFRSKDAGINSNNITISSVNNEKNKTVTLTVKLATDDIIGSQFVRIWKWYNIEYSLIK